MESALSIRDAMLHSAAHLVGRRCLWRIGRMLYAYGRLETVNSLEVNGERTLIRNCLRYENAPVVFDVGANVGEWSRAALEESQGARIHAFEPTPASQQALATLPIQVVPCALSDSEGRRQFLVRGTTAGTNTLAIGHRDGECIDVEVTTVSDYCARNQINYINLLKIDVEGFDLAVIRGALPLLRERRVGVLQFEYNGLWMHTRTLLKDVFDIAVFVGYRLGKVVPKGVVLYPHWHYELDRYFEANYVLVRPDLVNRVNAVESTFDKFNTFGVYHT